MLKVKISAIITLLLAVVSLLWVVYDYIALTNAVYKYGENLLDLWRNVSLGFIPIVLFHLSFFVTCYLLFGLLKQHKEMINELRNNKDTEEQKIDPAPTGK